MNRYFARNAAERDERYGAMRGEAPGYSKGKPGVDQGQLEAFVEYSNATTMAFNCKIVSGKVLPFNKLRVGMSFQNNGAGTIFIGIGSDPGNGTPAPSNAFRIAPGGFLSIDFNCPASDVYASSSIDDVIMAVSETTRVKAR